MENNLKLVIIESPYANIDFRYLPECNWFWRLIIRIAGGPMWNAIYARKCLKDSLSRGEAPLASHLLYTQKGVLDDKIQEERSKGIEAGLAWYEVADACVVYTDFGVSTGMSLGIARARELNKPIIYRDLYGRKIHIQDKPLNGEQGQ